MCLADALARTILASILCPFVLFFKDSSEYKFGVKINFINVVI